MRNNLSSLPEYRSCPVQIQEGTGSACHQTFGLSVPETHDCTADGKDELSLQIPTPVCEGVQLRRGLPTVRDRIAQTVCKMILEPIFEADFEDSSYGFRPKRSSKDAITAIKENLKQGKTEVYDADLSKYFDTIPHDKLQIALKERITDPRILKLINKWLKVPVCEDGKYTSGKSNGTGTPQGGVISPLLANIYFHLLDRIVNNAKSLFFKYGVKIAGMQTTLCLWAEPCR